MIAAVEALRLPSAAPTGEEVSAANELEVALEEHIRANMRYRGCEYEGKETRPVVVAIVNQRLKAAGYNADWQWVVQEHRLNAALTQTIGFRVNIAPNDEAYRALRPSS